MKKMNESVVMCVVLSMLTLMPQSCMIRTSNSKKVEAGSGRIITIDVKDIEEFDSIDLGLPLDIEYSYGEPSVTILCDDNYADFVKVKCREGKLELSLSPDKGALKHCTLKAKVSSGYLKSIAIAGYGSFEAAGIEAEEFTASIAGSGDIEINGIKADNLKMNIAGSGDIDIEDISARSVSGSIAGSGDISVSGKAEKASFNIAGSGDIDCKRLDCPNLNILK
ncbi:MAG: GIN domain-containing protein [Candidatus Cryptobacteroides sp.]